MKREREEEGAEAPWKKFTLDVPDSPEEEWHTKKTEGSCPASTTEPIASNPPKKPLKLSAIITVFGTEERVDNIVGISAPLSENLRKFLVAIRGAYEGCPLMLNEILPAAPEDCGDFVDALNFMLHVETEESITAYDDGKNLEWAKDMANLLRGDVVPEEHVHLLFPTSGDIKITALDPDEGILMTWYRHD